MKQPLATLAFLALSSILATAFQGSGTLTLTPPTTTENKLSIKISATTGGFTASDTKTTNVSGVLNVSVDSDPSTRATSKFTIHGGDVSMTDMAFNLKTSGWLPISVATFNTAGMKGTAFTRVPPGLATPTSTGGTFDASQHSLRINQGTITGTLTIPLQPPTPINADFATAPVEGPGTGTGTLTVVPGTATSTHRNCAVTMELPVDFTQQQDLNGIPVTVTVKGTIKAAGTIPIPLNSWIEWTDLNNRAGASFGSVLAPGGAPLGLAWAMGYDPDATAIQVTPVMSHGVPPTATVHLATGGSRGPLLLEQSATLISDSWQPVPASAISGGQNPLPVGTAGSVTVQWPDQAVRRFVRVSATQP